MRLLFCGHGGNVFDAGRMINKVNISVGGRRGGEIVPVGKWLRMGGHVPFLLHFQEP